MSLQELSIAYHQARAVYQSSMARNVASLTPADRLASDIAHARIQKRWLDLMEEYQRALRAEVAR
jgi:hypothetical protein